MRPLEQKLQKAQNTLRVVIQLAERNDLTLEEKKYLYSLLRSQQMAVMAKERQKAAKSSMSER